MEKSFKIYVDRLKNGNVEKILGSFDPDFFQIQEKDLQFSSPVELKGEIYLSEDHLILHLSGKTHFKMPCSICNQMIEAPLEIKNYYHTVPLSELPSAIYYFDEQLREAFLIELPKYLECSEGKCPSREEILPYMKRKAKTKDDVHFPFSDL